MALESVQRVRTPFGAVRIVFQICGTAQRCLHGYRTSGWRECMTLVNHRRDAILVLSQFAQMRWLDFRCLLGGCLPSSATACIDSLVIIVAVIV